MGITHLIFGIRMSTTAEARAKFIAARGKKTGNKVGGRRVANVTKKAEDEYSRARSQDKACWALVRKLKTTKFADCGSVVLYRDEGEECLYFDTPKLVQYSHENSVMIIEGKGENKMKSEIPQPQVIDPNILNQLKQSFAAMKQDGGNDGNDEI